MAARLCACVCALVSVGSGVSPSPLVHLSIPASWARRRPAACRLHVPSTFLSTLPPAALLSSPSRYCLLFGFPLLRPLPLVPSAVIPLRFCASFQLSVSARLPVSLYCLSASLSPSSFVFSCVRRSSVSLFACYHLLASSVALRAFSFHRPRSSRSSLALCFVFARFVYYLTVIMMSLLDFCHDANQSPPTAILSAASRYETNKPKNKKKREMPPSRQHVPRRRAHNDTRVLQQQTALA